MTDITALIEVAQTWTAAECAASPVGASRVIDHLADALEAEHKRAESAWRAAALANESEEAMADGRDRYRAEAESARKTGERILADALRYRAAIEEALGVRLDHTLPTHRAWPRYQDDVDRILIRALNENEGDPDDH